jgi:IMP cyclohydrolase
MSTYKAKVNLEALRINPYPGRGIIVGMDETGENLVQVYWIMGRSDNSRNRVFQSDDTGKVWTEAADPSAVEDPSLIIYTAMLEHKNGLCAVSNGLQTDAIIFSTKWNDLTKGFHEIMHSYKYEPDSPNFTPRISAICRTVIRTSMISKMLSFPPYAEMAILKKSPRGKECDRFFYSIEDFIKGVGLCMTTYEGPGDPLPSFDRYPYPLPLGGNIDDILQGYWKTLDKENKVSLAVKFIPLNGDQTTVKTINKNSQVK